MNSYNGGEGKPKNTVRKNPAANSRHPSRSLFSRGIGVAEELASIPIAPPRITRAKKTENLLKKSHALEALRNRQHRFESELGASSWSLTRMSYHFHFIF
jgi:hypothetical protein